MVEIKVDDNIYEVYLRDEGSRGYILFNINLLNR